MFVLRVPDCLFLGSLFLAELVIYTKSSYLLEDTLYGIPDIQAIACVFYDSF